MPGAGSSASVGSVSGRSRSRTRSASGPLPRRKSLSAERCPETVKEEDGEADAEDGNMLGLELGQARPKEVSTEPVRRHARHRSTNSAGRVLDGR